MNLPDGESNGDGTQPSSSINDMIDELRLPGVAATILQLEEVNRILTASVIALLQMQMAHPAVDKKGVLEDFNAFKQAALNTLDNQLKQRLAAVAGPQPKDQAEYLMQHPEAILFSGERIK